MVKTMHILLVVNLNEISNVLLVANSGREYPENF
jgi:hypothetical protein